MKNQKGISALVGIIIIIAVALVAFGGVFAYTYYNKTHCIGCAPVPESNESDFRNQNVQIADWKTYTNNEYGFEFKYPNDFYLNEIEGSIYVTDPLIEISFYKEEADYGKKPPVLTLGIRERSIENITMPTNAENYVFASKEAKLSCLKDGEEIVACTILSSYNDNTLYVISGVDFRSDDVLNKILSTFKFIP